VNEKIRTLIVDDVALARDRVRRYLEDESDIEIVGEAGNGSDAVALIERLGPDLVFLDVELPDFDGFEIAARIPAETRPVVIYLTAHGDRALQAFEVQALDYLVKPFDRDRFARALERARGQLRLRAGQGEDETAYLTTLTIRDGARTDVVDTAEIDYIDVAGHYLCVHVGRTVHLIRGSLGELDAQLDPNRFQRIHRSAIVAVDRVKRLTARRNGDADVLLACGTKLVLSRTYSVALRQRLS
jgi:two-component system LytT family response regulator